MIKETDSMLNEHIFDETFHKKPKTVFFYFAIVIIIPFFLFGYLSGIIFHQRELDIIVGIVFGLLSVVILIFISWFLLRIKCAIFFYFKWRKIISNDKKYTTHIEELNNIKSKLSNEPKEHVGKQMIISKIDNLVQQKNGNRSKVTYEEMVLSLCPDDDGSYKKLIEVFYLDPKGMGGKIDSLFEILKSAFKTNFVNFLLHIILLLVLTIIEMLPIEYSLNHRLFFPQLNFVIYTSIFIFAISSILFPVTEWIYRFRFSVIEEDHNVELLEKREVA